ncbi:MAG TPA: SigB/SigF/SigG family RNA polymerase sigma factor [Clostridia bacterium]|nr:SigB/SigF/SigG family RNA polymerase sigma factor [Clostridia bacterium]
MDEREPLSHEETLGLITRAQAGSEEAQERLVVCNTALVKSIVRRFLGKGCEYDDLFQIGCMGLVKAINNFDMSYDVRFSTYAVPMIAGEIKRFLRDDGIIKVSRSLRELAVRAACARDALANRLNREPGVVEIADALEVEPEELSRALEAARPCVSIYEPAYGADSDALVMDVVPVPEEELSGALDRVLLKELLGELQPRERALIVMRYFLDKTQSETAAALGISQVQVSRLESRILSSMRGRLQEEPREEESQGLSRGRVP